MYKSWVTLGTCTAALLISLATWAMNSVMVVYFLNKGLYAFTNFETGLLLAAPILTGAISRIPFGIMTDRYGGRVMFPAVMLISSFFLIYYSHANTFFEFLIASLGFGLSGSVFVIGIAYLLLLFPKERQGLVIGIFELSGVGVACTAAFAPQFLYYVTQNGMHLERWRYLPLTYALLMGLGSLLFLFFATTKKKEERNGETLLSKLKLCLNIRVLRFGLYYVFVFGGFIAISQWLILYYVSVYGLTVREAGLYATIFGVPCALIRVFGGWVADIVGPRRIMYLVFSLSVLLSLFLVVPQMELTSFGRGVYATCDGTVRAITPATISIESEGKIVNFDLILKPKVDTIFTPEHRHVIPEISHWNEPKVIVGTHVVKNDLIAHGVTHLYFNPPVWFFTVLVFLLGLLLGVGVVGVFKYIPQYFEGDVGTVSGIVGAIGGVGGFFFPILFSIALDATGFWTSCWFLLGVIALICLIWLHRVSVSLVKVK